jgi:serine/threonine-protein kinase
MMGSPYYMSPEQLESARNVDTRTDIWAIGVVLYELLTGRVPFVGDTLPEVVVKIVSHPLEPVRRHRPDVPPTLELVMSRCLEKDRTKRFANVAELGLALAEFAPRNGRLSVERISRVIQNAGLAPSMLPALPTAEPTSAPITPGTMSTWGQTAPRAGGGTKKVAGFVVAGLVALGAGGFVAMRREAPPPAAVLAPAPASTPSSAQALAPPPAAATAPREPAAPPSDPVAAASAASTSLPAIASTPAAPIAPARPGAPQRKAAPAPKPAQPETPAPAAPKPAAKPDCSPNFYFDSNGEKHFKPECFQ